MKALINNFKFEPDGDATLTDALCSYIKEQITFGRIKGGQKVPSIEEIAEATGLSFHKSRRVIERLANEGYVRSRPHVGTVVCSRGKNVLLGRVLVALPDVDACRYYPTQLINIIRSRLTEFGYAMSVVFFPINANGSITRLKSELIRAVDLVIAFRATPKVQQCLVESGVKHIFAFGDKPTVEGDSPWIGFSAEKALAQFADHCAKVGVKRVTQVRFPENEMLDAKPALASKGIGSSWITVPHSETGRGTFDGIMHSSYEMFHAMPRDRIPNLMLFWNAFVAQGALMAFLHRGIRVPEDVKMVSLSDTGFGPIYVKPLTRFENDPIAAGEKISNFALAVLAKGRLPPLPVISPQYVFGATFPF